MQAIWKLITAFDLLEWFWSRLACGRWLVRNKNPDAFELNTRFEDTYYPINHQGMMRDVLVRFGWILSRIANGAALCIASGLVHSGAFLPLTTLAFDKSVPLNPRSKPGYPGLRDPK